MDMIDWTRPVPPEDAEPLESWRDWARRQARELVADVTRPAGPWAVVKDAVPLAVIIAVYASIGVIGDPGELAVVVRLLFSAAIAYFAMLVLGGLWHFTAGRRR